MGGLKTGLDKTDGITCVGPVSGEETDLGPQNSVEVSGTGRFRYNLVPDSSKWSDSNVHRGSWCHRMSQIYQGREFMVFWRTDEYSVKSGSGPSKVHCVSPSLT